MGVAPARLRLEWIGSSEGQKYADTAEAFREALRALGPLPAGVLEPAVAKEEVHA